jgi:hypothetical protein
MLTAGTIAGIVFLALGAITLPLAIWFVIRGLRKNADPGWDDGFGWFAAAGVTGFFAIPALVFPLIGFGLVGYDSDYLLLKPVSGEVQEIASRQIADGKGMSTRYVAVINGQQYGIDDTRAALIKPGDTISLNCTKQFVYGSTNNGYACNWG